MMLFSYLEPQGGIEDVGLAVGRVPPTGIRWLQLLLMMLLCSHGHEC